jgi:nitronate monooxygenase
VDRLARLLGLSFPLLQAGMGGVAVPRLAAAVSEAGGGGVVALYKHSPDEIAALLADLRARTARPCGVNLIPELRTAEALHAQVAAVLGAAQHDLFFTFFGLPDAAVCRTIRRAGHPLLIQIGDAVEAREAFVRGADALIVQGSEAGGHHLGTTSLHRLLPEVRDLDLGLPLVASGGIATGGDLFRAQHAGASGALCGTLFVAARESAAHARFKQRVVGASAGDTCITRAFEIGWPGRPHRVLRGPLAGAGEALPRAFIARTTIAGKTYPIARFSAAVPTESTEGRIDEMAMYCGTSCASIHGVLPAAEIVHRFIREYQIASGGSPEAPIEVPMLDNGCVVYPRRSS